MSEFIKFNGVKYLPRASTTIKTETWTCTRRRTRRENPFDGGDVT